MIAYDVLTRAIADWKAGVRPSHGSGPHHAAAPVYDYAAEADAAVVEYTEDDAGAAGYEASSAEDAAVAESVEYDANPVEEVAYGESGAEVIEDVASGIVDVEET